MKYNRQGFVGNLQGCSNICFTCEKACGGCSWSEIDTTTGKVRFEPVPGWTARKVKLRIYGKGKSSFYTDTYHIIDCPLYEPTRKE